MSLISKPITTYLQTLAAQPTFHRKVHTAKKILEKGPETFNSVLDGLASKTLGSATAPTVEALERIYPYAYHLGNLPQAQAIRSVLSHEFYWQANQHLQTQEAIDTLRRDPILLTRTDQVLTKLKETTQTSQETIERFREGILLCPRAAFMNNFHEAAHIYSGDPIVMGAGEIIGGYDYQVALLLALDLKPGQTVLHLGTGTGWPGALMAHVIGTAGFQKSLDLNPWLLEAAEQRFTQFDIKNTLFQQESGMSYFKEGECFDRILCSFFFPWGFDAEDIRLALAKFVLQLKPGGIFLRPYEIDQTRNNMIVYHRIDRFQDYENHSPHYDEQLIDILEFIDPLDQESL